jgi:hypothetical protein
MARVEASSSDEFEEIVKYMEVEGSFGYTADHAPYVNWETHYAGTSPPFQPIREWVHRKWNDLDAGLKRAAMPEDTDSENEGEEFDRGETRLTKEEHKDAVAWVVVDSIAENGTKAIRFMERSIERAKGAIETIEGQYRNSGDPHAPFKILRDVLDFAFGESQDIVADEASDTGKLLQSGFVDVTELQTGNKFEREGR